MRLLYITLACALALGGSAFAAGATPTVVTPAQIHWVAGTGPLAGAEVAVLSGNPAKPGEYTMRLRLPNGRKFGPHFHGDVENVTVISGTLLVGLGDTMQVSKMIPLPAGSFVSVPAGLHHYAMARGVTVIEIHGHGPFSMTLVKPRKH